VIRSLLRGLVVVAGFLAAPLLSHAAIINQSEGMVFSASRQLSVTSQLEASVDSIVVAGTWPNGTIKLIPGAGSQQRIHPQNYTMTLCFTPNAVASPFQIVRYYFRWQDANNYHEIRVSQAGSPDRFHVRWYRVKNGSAELMAEALDISSTLGTYAAVVISVSGVAPVTVAVRTKAGTTTGCTLGNGSVTQQLSTAEAAGAQGLASWTGGQDRLVGDQAGILWQYYVMQKADTYTLNGLPSNREGMVCTNGDVYLGKVTSAAPTVTFGTTALLPMPVRIKVKTDTDADDCTTGTIWDVFNTHALTGGTIHRYSDDTLVGGPTYGLPRYQTTTFDVPTWGLFYIKSGDTVGTMKIGWKLQADSWPGTACTGTETCSSEKALTGTTSGLRLYRAFVTATGFAVSSTHSIRIYHCVSSVCTVQKDQLTVKTPAAPGTDGQLTVIFTDCHNSAQKPYVLWSRMAGYNADLTLFIGDVYYDGLPALSTLGPPFWEPEASTREDKEIKFLDVTHDPQLAEYRLTHAMAYMWDDHDTGCNNGTPASNQCDETTQADGSLFTNASLVWDDYVGTGAAAEGLNPPALRTGTRYWTYQFLNTLFVTPDHMTYRMKFQDPDERKYGEAAPSLQASGTIAASTNSVVTPVIPAHATNDILLLQAWIRDVDDTLTVSGWTQITTVDRGTTARYWWYYLRATSGSTTNPLVDRNTSSGDLFAVIYVFRGATTSGDPWEVKNTAATNTTDPAVLTGITTLSASSLIVAAVMGEDNNTTSVITTGTDPSAYTEVYAESATGADGMLTMSYASRNTTGATGNVQVDFAPAVPIGWGGLLMALKPAGFGLLGTSGTATNGGTTITCSGCDFVTQAVAADDRAYFGSATAGRWYRVTSRDSATQISVTPNVNCGASCTSQNLDVVTTIKSMLGTQQFVDLSEAIKNTTAAQVYHAFSKGLYYTAGVDAWGTQGCEPTDQTNCESNASYGYEWERTDYQTLLCNNGAANNDFFVTGDSHLNYIVDHENIASCSQKEVAVAGIGFSSYNNVVKYHYGNAMNSRFLRATASGRSFGVTEINTAGTDTSRTRVIGENGDVLLDTTQDATAAFNVHASVVNSRSQPRLVEHSSGRCVTLYYNGTAQELVMSDPNCVFNPSLRLTATLTGRGLDLSGSTGALVITGNTVTACYPKGTSSADWYVLMVRTATINAGTPSIAWNADETAIVTSAGTTFGTNMKIYDVAFARGSDGFLYCSVSVTDNNSPFYVQARVLRSATADTLSGTWGFANMDNGETNAKQTFLVNTGGTKMLLLEQFTETDTTLGIYHNEWTGSAWCYSVNTMPLVKAGVTTANESFLNAAGDGSGNAVVAYLTDTSPGYLKAKPFTTNATCTSSSWGAEIVLANNEPAFSQTISYVGGTYWLLATNGLTSYYLYKSTTSTPTVVGDFLAGTLTLPTHFKYTRLTAMNNGASRLLLVAEVAAYPNAPLTDSPMLKTFQAAAEAASLFRMLLNDEVIELWE